MYIGVVPVVATNVCRISDVSQVACIARNLSIYAIESYKDYV